MKNKLLLTLTSLAATTSACVLPLTLTSCNSKKTYDIDILTEDKIGYIIAVTKPYFEYRLSIKGLKENDVIYSEITKSSANKVKIDEAWKVHTITAEEARHGCIMLKVVPISDSPEQDVFSDIFSIDFKFLQDEKVCYSEEIKGFSLDAAITTKKDMFEIETSGQAKILKGFDMTKIEEIKKCGILVIPADIYRISDKAFSVADKAELFEIFKSIKWLLLDETFQGKCQLDIIGKNAFEGCPFTETLYIPTTVRWIEDSAFSGCNKFSYFQYLGNTESALSSIKTNAFYGTVFGGTLSIPNATNLTTLETGVFGKGTSSDKKATNLVISKNIKTFKAKALEGFKNLQSIDLSDYTEVPTKFDGESFYSFPKQGTIYVHSQELIEQWTNAFRNQVEGKYVFPDFVNGNWTFEVK